MIHDLIGSKKVVSFLTVLFVSMVKYMITNTPADLKVNLSNISLWLEFFGLKRIPNFLYNPAIDVWANRTWWSVVILIIILFIVSFFQKSGKILLIFDKRYVSFSEAAIILESASGAWEHSYGFTQTGEVKTPEEHFIQQKLICAIQSKEDILKIYYEDSSHRKFQVLQMELEELGIDHREYLRFFVKKSELYKYVLGQISKTKAYNKIHNKREELEKTGHISSHELIKLQQEEKILERKITNYMYR